ncbi:MAG: 2-keto-4-pentenoate hydratase [Ramlibacter sp.]|nr:2-keto-4-pentenoate hydratase [Ramlibacter sp.]
MSSYKLLTHQVEGAPRAGILVADRIHDAQGVTGNAAYASVLGILDDWAKAEPSLAQAADSIAAGSQASHGLPLAKAKLLAPVLYPGEIYCAGGNYKDHMAEMAAATGRPPAPTMKDLGEMPWHFLKSGRSTVVGPDSAVALPAYSKMVDWEIELAAVIGRPARNVSVDEALRHVAGYTIANDLSARDAMKRPKTPPSSPMHVDWVAHKCFDGSCPIGPWIVPAAQIPNPHALGLKLWVNGELMQDSNTSELIFDVAEQIAALSSRITLQPGDLVLTGTPAGVGMARNRFLKANDVVKLWIEEIGEMSHRMV